LKYGMYNEAIFLFDFWRQKMNNRAGYYKTNFPGKAEYKSFVPADLPPVPPLNIDNEMMRILIQAHKQLGMLLELSANIPDLNLFIEMYVRKESVLSSQIEGTQATLLDIFDPKINRNTNLDVAEVVNCIKATDYAINALNELPLCNRLIKQTHAVLLDNARGANKSPGEFRSSQNWIGGQGSTLKNAVYIPPELNDMHNAMSELEKFMNEDSELDELVKAALIHYQFETIHPFLDGNGRIGRLLIILYLIDKKILSSPVLYISYYLKKNRTEYYDRMSEVRKNGNYEQWVKFMLKAITQSAQDACSSIVKLAKLHERNLGVIKTMGKSSKNTEKLLTYLEHNPIIAIKTASEALGIAFNTVSEAVRRLIDKDILVIREDFNRNRTFAYKEYLEILTEGTDLYD